MVRVVCVSRTIAAGAEAVGRLAADALGFRYVDDQIITLAARQGQVDPALVAKAEHRQRLLDRLLEKLPAARDLAGAVALAPSLQLGADRRQARALPEDMRTLIRHAIHEIGRRGDAVIVAHAASMALTDMDGVLRVLVTASPHTRALRLAESESLDPAAAAAAVAESDGERRDYFRRFYKLEQELPTHYDLTLSTDVLTAAEAAAAIVAAARG